MPLGMVQDMGKLSELFAATRAVQALPPIVPEGTTDVVSPWAPSDYLGTVEWSEDLPSLDALPLSRHSAMQIAALARSRNVITGAIARFPIVAMRGTNPLGDQPLLTSQPEVGRPRSVTMTWLVDALFFYGRAWTIAAERDSAGRPSRLQWVPEWFAEVDAYGQLTAAFGKPVQAADVVRFDGPHEGVLNFGSAVLREAQDVEASARNASANPVPSIELHQTGGEPLTTTEIDALTSRWERARRRKGGGVAYTNESIETRVHGQAAEQLLIDGRNIAALNIARISGLPAWAVDAVVSGSSLTYSNTPSRSRELIDYGLSPYLNAIESRLSMDDLLPRGTWARFDTSDLLRGDFKAQMEGYQIAIAAGIYTAEECRAMQNGSPLEEASAVSA